MRLSIDRHVYQPSHGPQVWPWWKLITIKIVRCSHDPYWYFWITPISWNIWIYTRWGARCCTYRDRRGVYSRDQYGALDGGYFDPRPEFRAIRKVAR